MKSKIPDNRGYVDGNGRLILEDFAIWHQRDSDSGHNITDESESSVYIEIGVLDGGEDEVGFVGDSIELFIPNRMASLYTARTRLRMTIEVIDNED